ncbi:1-acylglycerol-3-phosphate O-acyltransferase ABHD5-like isoform X2 [Sycon ciliatum]|uniref:1-acylglycerol-3-phosphate O-acyltransferase ABHD5-like isoform X2 n=1 Tax=Sycon ciliatum TaxID=27933 RepID=UPI0031F699EF
MKTERRKAKKGCDSSTFENAAGFGLLTIPLWFWIPSSAKILEEAERQCFRYVKAHVKRELVRTDTGLVISTATIRGGDDVRSDINHPPVLLLHGFAGGAGIWCKNVDAIAANRVVYAIDMVGFGRSSRPVFGEDPQSIEDVFVASVEAWRRTMSIASFILVGHSLGGYVSAAYALKHPSRVEHLVLADSWGMPERPDNHIEQRGKLPGWIQALRPIVNYFNPLAALRAVGPLGAMMLRTVRPDLQSKYKDMFDDTTMTDYIYHLNAQPAPSGEAAMKSLSIPFGWAKLPMLPRLIQHLDMDVPMTLLYGERSWIDSRIGYKLQDARPHSYVDVRVVSRAGHHVYSDQSRAFNEIMVEVCTRVTDHLTSSAEDEDDGD